MQSKIVSQLAVDDVFVQDADYRFNEADRSYIDEQIRGTQQHVVEGLVNGKIGTYFDLDGASAAVIPGDTVCQTNFASGTVSKLTTALMADAKTVAGVVIKAASPGGKVLVCTSGILPSSITGLGVGTGTWIKANGTTSRLERTAALLSTDFGVGTVTPSGWAYVVPGMRNPGTDLGGIGGIAAISASELRYTANAKQPASSYVLPTVQTSNATPTAIFTFAATLNRTYYLTGFVTAVGSTSASRFMYRVEQFYDQTAGTLTARISSPTGGVTELHESSGSVTVVADVSGTTGRVMVTGLGATTLTWGGQLMLVESQF